MKTVQKSQSGTAGDRGGGSAWPLFLRVHAVLMNRIEERLRAAGLPELAWYDILWALESAAGRRLRMHELAERTVVSRSNVTRLVDRLEAAGLVTRDRACADRRGAYAVLTQAGLAMRRRMWPVYARAIEDLFERHMSEEERHALRAVLARMLRGADVPPPPTE
jgi:DNA-binding MarR family transcriptional regulator